ncbi:MAG: ABC transporter ATP-binding protein [Candidatus Brockarchaeota archaeon]|nr:ABC transporter ATP-binding protein [Candidatus Brockarchaeota archaeon]
MTPEFSFEMLGITKKFPNVLALDNVDFKVKVGEIRALLGENGAGKTTLMKVLCGLYRPDSGKILVRGKEARIRSPKDAIGLGIGMVHQRFALVESMSVLENVVLGTKMDALFPLRRARADVEELAEKFGLKVDLDAKAWQIPASEQQKVEILKAMYRGAKILVLDEPTSMIAPSEYETLFKSLIELSRSGTAIVFITHKLKEAMSICDTITIMRRGKVVANCDPKEVSAKELAEMMIGRDLQTEAPQKSVAAGGQAVLEVEDLFVENDRGMMAVKGVSLSLRRGEILGVAGVSGNGQTELMEAIAGMRRPKGGRVTMDGKELSKLPPWKIRELGLAYVPESKRVAISPGLSVSENAILKSYSKSLSRGFLMMKESVSEYARQLVEKFNVVAPSLEMPAKFLSGGNAQKIVLGRELMSDPKVIVAGNPTSGLDVSSTELGHGLFLQARAKGVGILLISEDVDEILKLSDRIAVMLGGKITKVFDRTPPLDELSLAMTFEQ